MSRDKKRSRHLRGGGESDDYFSVLGSALDSGRNSARNLSRSRRTSRTNSTTTSRSSSRARGLDINNDELTDDEDDEKYQKKLNDALDQSLKDFQRSLGDRQDLAMEGSPLFHQQQQQQQQQEEEDNIARFQYVSFDDDDENDDEGDNYDAGDDVDELDDVDSEDEEDEDEEEEEEEDDDEKEKNAIRTPLQDVLHENSSHHYAEWARLLCEHGFVQKDTLDAVAVIPPQPPPTGEDASNAVLFLALYPCGKDKEHSGNKTTNDLLDLLNRHGLAAFVFWCDAALMSANKTNKVFNYAQIGVALNANPALRSEFFERFRDDVIALHNDTVFSLQNKYVVCVLCGKDIAEKAFDLWVTDGFITIEEQLYGDDDNIHEVVLASFSFGSRNFEVLVVRGMNHPSAHFHAHKQRQMKEALENSCSLIVATKHYAQRTTATTTTTTTTTTIKEYLVKLNATYIETMEVRKSKWRILLPTPEDWRKVFVAGKSLWFQKQFAVCRNMQLENPAVFKNVQIVFETFDTKLALKLLRTDGFAYRLGRVNASEKFVEKLLRVFKQYCHAKRKFFEQIACNGLFAHLFDAEFFEKMDEFFAEYCGNKPELFARFACDGLFAHYRDAEFFKKMDEFFAKYCGNKPALFPRFACNSFFAHLFDDGFFRRLEQVRDEVFKGDQGALVKAMCDSLFAALANDKKYTNFRIRLEQVRDEVFKGDQGALATACRDSLWIRYALANRDEAHITELKKGLQNSREQQQGQQPKPEPRQPKFRRPEPRL